MSQLVYLRDRHPHSVLVFSKVGDGYRLRDFSGDKEPAVEIERQSTGRTGTDVENEVQTAPNKFIRVPDRSIEDYRYWHDLTLEWNRKLVPKELLPLAPPESSLKKHTREIIVGVIISILTALILAWLGLKD